MKTTEPSEEIVWLACESCGYGAMFMTLGVVEKPAHVCGTTTFIPIVGYEDDEEDDS